MILLAACGLGLVGTIGLVLRLTSREPLPVRMVAPLYILASFFAGLIVAEFTM